MQTGSSRVGSSGDVFAPRREIPRTPPRVRQEARVDVGPGPVSKNVATTSTLVEDRENIPPDWSSPSNHRKVQAPCFTPSRSLVRSPPPAGQVSLPPEQRLCRDFTSLSLYCSSKPPPRRPTPVQLIHCPVTMKPPRLPPSPPALMLGCQRVWSARTLTLPSCNA